MSGHKVDYLFLGEIDKDLAKTVSWSLTKFNFSVLTEVYEMLNEDCFKKQKVFRQSYMMFSMMDKNSDGKITEVEFVKACMDNQDLMNMLEIEI